jgi:phosphoribosylglycinamide formyltransferase-1
VNEEYDKGEVILQVKCIIESTDTPELLAKKIQALEYEYLPKAIEKFL